VDVLIFFLWPVVRSEMWVIINRASSGGCIEVPRRVGVSPEEEVEKLKCRRLFVYKIIFQRLDVNLSVGFLDGVVGRIDLGFFPGGRCSRHDDWEKYLSVTSMSAVGLYFKHSRAQGTNFRIAIPEHTIPPYRRIIVE
jgi:hypothetical protein